MAQLEQEEKTFGSLSSGQMNMMSTSVMSETLTIVASAKTNEVLALGDSWPNRMYMYAVKHSKQITLSNYISWDKHIQWQV